MVIDVLAGINLNCLCVILGSVAGYFRLVVQTSALHLSLIEESMAKKCRSMTDCCSLKTSWALLSRIILCM